MLEGGVDRHRPQSLHGRDALPGADDRAAGGAPIHGGPDQAKGLRRDHRRIGVDREAHAPFEGPASLDLDVERLDLARVDHLLQLADTLEGVVSLDMTVLGTADEPEIEARFQVDAFRYQDFAFEALRGDLDYRGRSLTGEIDVVEAGRRILALTGRAPAQLVLDTVGFGIPDEPIALTVIADSLPLSMLLALTNGMGRTRPLASAPKYIIRTAGSEPKLSVKQC